MGTGVADSAWNEKDLQWAEFMAGNIFGSKSRRKTQPENARHTN
jgi:hypothetical protein